MALKEENWDTKKNLENPINTFSSRLVPTRPDQNPSSKSQLSKHNRTTTGKRVSNDLTAATAASLRKATFSSHP